MKKGIAVLVVAALVGLAGLLWWQAGMRPSELPDFDSAEFNSLPPDAAPPVTIAGAEVAKLREIFEGVPADRWPSKWQVFGLMKLRQSDRVVLEIDVFSNLRGAGPFRFNEKRYYLGYDQQAFRELLKANGWQPEPRR